MSTVAALEISTTPPLPPLGPAFVAFAATRAHGEMLTVLLTG
jgi:hypothetical protein